MKPGAGAAPRLRRPTRSPRKIVDMATPLEGLVRNDSIHAAAVVIGDRPLTEYLPLQQKGADSEVVTQFSMGDVEALGLLKMDFLGLRNLDVIDERRRLDRAVARRASSTMARRCRSTTATTYEMLARGDATGVFQFESSGMRDALRQVKPTELRRPRSRWSRCTGRGRCRTSPTYARSKNGREPVTYADERLEPILGATHGHLPSTRSSRCRSPRSSAGFTPAEADDLRKAIGKKIARADGLAASRSSSTAAPRNGVAAGGGRRSLWAENERCGRLLVQQGPRRLLRADRLPHRLPRGQLPRPSTWPR